jgi:hypothetical protein
VPCSGAACNISQAKKKIPRGFHVGANSVLQDCQVPTNKNGQIWPHTDSKRPLILKLKKGQILKENLAKKAKISTKI